MKSLKDNFIPSTSSHLKRLKLFLIKYSLSNNSNDSHFYTALQFTKTFFAQSDMADKYEPKHKLKSSKSTTLSSYTIPLL